MEALISRTLGYAPGTFVIQEEVNEAVEEDQVQVEFIETLYGNQKDILKVLGELNGKDRPAYDQHEECPD